MLRGVSKTGANTLYRKPVLHCVEEVRRLRGFDVAESDAEKVPFIK